MRAAGHRWTRSRDAGAWPPLGDSGKMMSLAGWVKNRKTSPSKVLDQEVITVEATTTVISRRFLVPAENLLPTPLTVIETAAHIV